MENNRRTRDDLNTGNQKAIMEVLSKILVNHNVARDDHKEIYREISTLEAAMGSTVRSATAGEVAGVRLDLKKIFDSFAEDTPRPTHHSTPKKGTRGRVGKEAGVGARAGAGLGKGKRKEVLVSHLDSDSGSDTETEAEGRVRVRITEGKREWGTIGGKRGGARREGTGRAGDPIVIETLRGVEAGNQGRHNPLPHQEVGEAEEQGEVDGREEKEELKAEPKLEQDTITSTSGPTHEAIERESGNFSEGMPGQWEMSPTASLDPTPVQGLTLPRRDLIPEVISAVRDELTIGFIANEIPMEPELSPEPEEPEGPTTTVANEHTKEREEEMLRQVEKDSRRQG